MESEKEESKKYPEPYSEKWNSLAYRVARDYCPTIYPCKKCNYPVVEGYCCHGCGTSEPR